jgi:uncharacterized protein (TIGR03437 family)
MNALIVVFLAILLPLHAQGSCPEKFSAGFRVARPTDLRAVAIWYPAVTPERSHTYAATLVGRAAPEAEPSNCTRFPVVVFSHGYSGCGIQSVFLMEELARAGYIIAAPDHADATCTSEGQGSIPVTPTDASFLQPDQWTDQTEIDRRDDVQRTLAWVLSHPEFSRIADPDHIGVAGHSLGGYTALGMMGAWRSWKDERIKAGLLLSPYLLPFLTQRTLSGVSAPVMYQGAQWDFGVTPFLRGDSGAYGQTQSPKFYAELRGGSHFEWTNAVCLGETDTVTCISRKPNAQLIVGYAIKFLDRYLKNRNVLGDLTGSGLAAYQRLVPLLPVSAASYLETTRVSPDSIVSGFADALADVTISAASQLPESLGNAQIRVRDARGAEHLAPLFFISPNQVNFLLPDSVAPGVATIRAFRGPEVVASGDIQVDPVAPGIFTARANGRGVAAGQFVRVDRNGNQTIGNLFEPGSLDEVPVELGEEGEAVYLVLYGTGMRLWGDAVTATAGGIPVSSTRPFRHSIFRGLDQVNIGPLPQALRGRSSVSIVLSIGAKYANAVTVTIR